MVDNEQISGEVATTEAVPVEAPKAQAAAQPRLYTEEEAKAFASSAVKERLARERAKMNKQPETQEAPRVEAVSAVSDADFQDAFDEVSEELGTKIPLAFKRQLRDAYRAIKPSDSVDWVRTFVKNAGFAGQVANSNPSPQPQTQTKQDQSPPPGQANQAIPSAGIQEPSTDVPVSKWTREQIARFQQIHGMHKANRMIADMSRQQRATMTIALPTRK
jgi:hypothetical protein